MKRIILSFLILATIPACSPVGAAAGAGAALGISAASERGVSGTASDLKIKALISDKWFKYDLSTFTKLNLTVNEGRVLITGIVQDPDDRVEAVRLAWQVEGVQQVINEIRVADGEGLPGYVRDQWISTRLRTALTFDREVHSINYSIDTVAGTVYLMGVARNQGELERVMGIARTIPHVMQVISYVKISGEHDAGTDASAVGSAQQPSMTAPQISAPPQQTPIESEQLYWPDQ